MERYLKLDFLRREVTKSLLQFPLDRFGRGRDEGQEGSLLLVA
ncbi:MAG: hypothetical protein H6Q52_3583, partial [Deltaproteobacteria bacterium]|nr:hypothetical protein [Deltaproteobacteria bacterium]